MQVKVSHELSSLGTMIPFFGACPSGHEKLKMQDSCEASGNEPSGHAEHTAEPADE